MPDLAELGIRVTSQEAAVADERLGSLASAAGRAETGVERLAAAARRSDGSVTVMNAAVRQQTAVLQAHRNVAGLNSNEMLNLSRQFADVGVSLASGQSLWMVAIQQGAQIGDTFQSAATRGVGFSAALRSIWVSLTPIMTLLSPIILGLGAIGGGFAIAAQQINADNKKLIDELGLTEKQLKKVKDQTVTMGDVMVGVWQATSKALGKAFATEIDGVQTAFGRMYQNVVDDTAEEARIIVGFFVGAFEAIRVTWSALPAAIGDAAITAVNVAIKALDGLVNKSIDGLNNLIAAAKGFAAVNPLFSAANLLSPIANVDFAPIENEYAGSMERVARAGQAGFARGTANGRGFVDSAMAAIERETLAAFRRRVAREAGDPGAAGGKSEGEKEYERLMKAGEAFRLGLVKEREELGLTAIERKMLEAQTQANTLLTSGHSAASRELADQIMREARALEEATLANQHSEAMKKQSQVREMLELERDLIGASNVERARQIAMLQTEIDLRNRLGKAASTYIASGRGQAEIRSAGDTAAQGAMNGNALAAYNLGLSYQLDLLRQIDEQTRSAAHGMADAFGTAGRAVGDVVAAFTGLRAQIAEINDSEKRYRDSVGEQGVTQERLGLYARERAQAEIASYGDMAAAAKGFFREGSDGYHALQAAEAAFRAFQFAMSVQAMAQTAAETSASVAGSAAKGAASAGAGAAKMFETLGPLGFPVVAAMLAVLASLGMRGKGGGGGSAPSKVDASVTSAQGFAAQQEQAKASFAGTVAQQVEVRVTADRDGLNAFVEQTAENVARPMVVQGMAAAAGATRAQVMSDLDRSRTYSRGGD